MTNCDNFSEKTKLCVNRAQRNFFTAYETKYTPYYDFKALRSAVTFPAYHSVQLLKNVMYGVYGCLILTGSVLTLNFKNMDEIAWGMIRLFSASLMELSNTFFAILLLPTRLFATITNFGFMCNTPCSENNNYLMSPADEDLNHLHEPLIADDMESRVSNFDNTNIGFINRSDQRYHDMIYKQATTII
ncbi:MAG: hypothetical protein ACOVQX_04630 [Legionella sp.]